MEELLEKPSCKKKICKNRSKAVVSAYLILQKDSKTLLSLRKDTGYEDGKYGLVAGHVEQGESVKAAMVREAYEEIGIKIKPESLQLVHIMHRKTDRNNIDFFFRCCDYDGDIINKEPNKCAEINFFSGVDIPFNTIGYIRQVLLISMEGKNYSEFGWEDS